MTDIKDTEAIVSGIDKIKNSLMEFSHPEDLIPLFKLIKKNVPWYRRKDFYSYVTYLLLSGEKLQFTAKENKTSSQDRFTKNNFKNQVQSGVKKDKTSQNGNMILWINYSPRTSENSSAFKAFIALCAGISEDEILSIAAKRYCSFVSFANEGSLNKVLKSLNGKTFEGRTIKANIKNNSQ